MNPDDPVAEFFARERASVEPLPTQDQRWQDIVATHRRRRRPRRWASIAGVAAAALAAGSIGWVLRPAPNPAAGLAPASTSPASVQPVPSPLSPPVLVPEPTNNSPAPPPAGPSTRTLPRDFVVRSLSNAGGGTLFALGTSNCAGTTCTVVARSTDNGATWRQTATLTGAQAPGQRLNDPGTNRSLTQIRFANPSVGWVFGGGLMLTTDGGLTFTTVSHPGGAVVALSTDGARYVVVTADICSGASCSGDVQIASGPIDAAQLRGGPSRVATVPGTGEMWGASVAWKGGDAVVDLEMDGLAQHTFNLLAARNWQARAVDPSCGPVARSWVVSSATMGDTTFGKLCDLGWTDAGPANAPNTRYALSRATAGAPAWGQISSTLNLPSGDPTFAAADDMHLLAVSNGAATTVAAMQISVDGGKTWRAPKSPPAVPDAGWDWVGAPGAGMYYAIPAGGDGAFWISTDKGETWRQVAVARQR